jgi:hypothetical protein
MKAQQRNGDVFPSGAGQLSPAGMAVLLSQINPRARALLPRRFLANPTNFAGLIY